MGDIDLTGEMDAEVWTRHWLDIISSNPHIPTDKDTMIGWFSNAIMAGYDQGRRFEQRRDVVEKLREIIFQVAGAATLPLLEDHPDYMFPSDRVVAAVEKVCESFGIPKEN